MSRPNQTATLLLTFPNRYAKISKIVPAIGVLSRIILDFLKLSGSLRVSPLRIWTPPDLSKLYPDLPPETTLSQDLTFDATGGVVASESGFGQITKVTFKFDVQHVWFGFKGRTDAVEQSQD